MSLYSKLPIRLQQMIDRLRSPAVRQIKSAIYNGRIGVGKSELICRCGAHDTSRLNIDAPTRNVVLVWDPLRGSPGSVVMRVQQLSRRLAAACPRVEISICPIQSPDVRAIKDSLVIVTKSVLRDPVWLANVDQARNILLADYVDGTHNDETDSLVDGFLCASAVEHQWIGSNLRKPSFLVPHAIDDRLFQHTRGGLKPKFSCGYFGHPENGFAVRELERLGLVDVFDTTVELAQDIETSEWARGLSGVSAHYIARPPGGVEVGRFKPFTKGFTAAFFNSVAISGRWDDESVYWLGADYPFHVNSANLSSVGSAIRECHEKWELDGCAEVQDLLKTLRQRSCPVQNSLDCFSALNYFD
ncbi:MAG: hypothetical protein EBU84_18580 [Actinobacteria bacterium]|nr:hypothetical protein [Actinomycetota bacterium]